jgi:hypothetical protein
MKKIGLAIFAFALTAPSLAAADGALAVGATGDVVKDGIAMGDGYNYPSPQEAMDRALAECRKPGGAATTALNNCMIVATFKGQCDATALDPQSGTPGAGWAIAEDQTTAESRAIANCQATAGAARRQFCKIMHSNCDTSQ